MEMQVISSLAILVVISTNRNQLHLRRCHHRWPLKLSRPKEILQHGQDHQVAIQVLRYPVLIQIRRDMNV